MAKPMAIMDPARLLGEELEHELQIRGRVTALMSFEEKVEWLTNNADRQTLTEVLEDIKPTAELLVLSTKVSEMKALMSEFRNGQSTRLAALYLHCVGRVRRSMFRDPASFEGFKYLTVRMKKVYDAVRKMFPDVDFPQVYSPDDDHDSPPSRDRSPSPRRRRDDSPRRRRDDSPRRERKIKKEPRYREKKGYRSDTSSSSDSSRSGSSNQRRSQGRSRNNPVARWGMSFSQNEDLHNFLDDVEEAAEMNEVSDEELLRGISSLLKGPAKSWYRGTKAKIGSWKGFKKQLKEAFRPDEDDDGIKEQIDRLQQHSDESFVVFEARASELFRKLNRPYREDEKLSKLLKGLHFYYRSRIRMKNIASVRELRAECKDLEADKTQIMKLEKKERKRDDKEDRRDSRRHVKAAAVELSGSSDDGAAEAAAVRVTGQASGFSGTCWRCGRHGHMSINCKEKIFCLCCGAKDTVAERCQNCAKAAAAGKWSQSGKAAGDLGGGAKSLFSQPPPQTPTKILQPLMTSTPQVSKNGQAKSAQQPSKEN